jgi:hypothetical protein
MVSDDDLCGLTDLGKCGDGSVQAAGFKNGKI